LDKSLQFYLDKKDEKREEDEPSSSSSSDVEVTSSEETLMWNKTQKDGQLDLIYHIQKVLKEQIYYWKTFHFDLPHTILPILRELKISPRELFSQPSYTSELYSLAFENGRPKSLTREQKNDIWKTGRFKVESKQFEGQFHVWELSRLIQKGSENVWNLFVQFVALALREIIISLPKFLFSIRRGWYMIWGYKNLVYILWDFYDLLFGMRRMERTYYDSDIDTQCNQNRIQNIFDSLQPDLTKQNISFNSKYGIWVPIHENKNDPYQIDTRILVKDHEIKNEEKKNGEQQLFTIQFEVNYKT